jgi:hypothetical protein
MDHLLKDIHEPDARHAWELREAAVGDGAARHSDASYVETPWAWDPQLLDAAVAQRARDM